MESNKFLHKCGEILVDIKSKNKKNKIYFFQCTFCDIQCDQLKKFSLHIGEEHLNDFDQILKEAQNLNETEISKETEYLKETELKFEAEPEEFKIPSFNDIEETPDIKVFPNPIETKININPDPLDTVTAGSTSTNTENLNCEVKYEIIEHEDEDEGAGDMEIMGGTVSISDSDKSDSDEDYIEEVPHKKRKTSKTAKKGKQTKRKENSNDTESDESKDAECNNTVARQSLTREERLEKKRAAERLRYQRIKNDPEKYAMLKAKEHMKYEKKKEKGKIKTVKQMTAEEKEQARKLWREKTKRQRLRRYAKFKFKLETSSASDISYLNNKTSLNLKLTATTFNKETLFHVKSSPNPNVVSKQIENTCINNSSQNNMSSIMNAPRDTSLNYLTTYNSTLHNPLKNTSLNNEKSETRSFNNTTISFTETSYTSNKIASKETSSDCSAKDANNAIINPTFIV